MPMRTTTIVSEEDAKWKESYRRCVCNKIFPHEQHIHLSHNLFWIRESHSITSHSSFLKIVLFRLQLLYLKTMFKLSSPATALLIALLVALPNALLSGVSAATSNAGLDQTPALERPSSRFLSKCVNKSGYEFKNKAGKSCEWVGNKKKRCRKKDKINEIDVADACPGKCDLKCRCKNSRVAFKFEGQGKTCKTMKMRDCGVEIKGGKTVQDYCPKKCKVCYDKS